MENNYQDMSLFDFIVLCAKKLWALIVLIFKILHHIITVCWKRWYFIATFVILGVVYAWFWAKPEFSRYTGQATIYFPDNMKMNIESGLQGFVNEAPASVGLTLEQVKTLKVMKYYNCIDAKMDGTIDFVDSKEKVPCEDSTRNIAQDRLTIELQMRTPFNFDEYEQAFKNYFNTREEFTVPAKRWREMMQRKIDIIDREIARTDSFINQEYFESNSSIVVGENLHVGYAKNMRYCDMQWLTNEREKLVEQLAKTPEVINFETHFHFYTMLIYMKYFYGMLVGFLMGIAVAYIVEYRKEILNFLHFEK